MGFTLLRRRGARYYFRMRVPTEYVIQRRDYDRNENYNKPVLIKTCICFCCRLRDYCRNKLIIGCNLWFSEESTRDILRLIRSLIICSADKENGGEIMSWKCELCGADNPGESSIRCACGYERQENEISSKNYSGKKVLFWIGEILSVCGAIYCMMGYAMVASFSVAAPQQKDHWESMAWLYVGGIAVCSILMVVFAVAIFWFGTKKAN
jgi:hypothetical protein